MLFNQLALHLPSGLLEAEADEGLFYDGDGFLIGSSFAYDIGEGVV